MKISKVASASFDDIYNMELDAIIVASGYETRARAIAYDIFTHADSSETIKYAWGFEESANELARLENDMHFAKMGYKVKMTSGSDCVAPENWFGELLDSIGKKPARLLVDISSMTRNWYGGIVSALARSSCALPVNVLFAYAPAKWSGSMAVSPPNEVLGPVHGYASHALPNRPVALLMGLGQEKDRALGLKDYLDPQKTICFYANPAADRRYVSSVHRTNSDLLAAISPEGVYTFDLFDPYGSYKILESVCQGLIREYRVVLASLGPKIFGLYCFLIQRNYPETSVWRISPATRQLPFDHKPGQKRIVISVSWNTP